MLRRNYESPKRIICIQYLPKRFTDNLGDVDLQYTIYRQRLQKKNK